MQGWHLINVISEEINKTPITNAITNFGKARILGPVAFAEIADLKEIFVV